MAGGPFRTFQTGDPVTNNIQAAVKDVFDQLENARQGVLALPASIFTRKATLRDEAFVIYRGGTDTIILPVAAQRGRGTAMAVFVMNEGMGSLTVTPSQFIQVGGNGKPDVLTGGNVTLTSGNWAIFASDGYQTWFTLTSNTITAVTSVKAGAGGTPRTGALELDGAGGTTVTDAGGGVFTISSTAVPASIVNTLKVGAGGTPRTGAIELDGTAGGVGISDSGTGVFTFSNLGVTSVAGSTGGVFAGSITIQGAAGGDIATSGAAGIITITGKRDGSYQNYAHVPGGAGLTNYVIAGTVSADALTTRTNFVNQLIAIPFVAPVRGGLMDRLGAEVVTASAATNVRVALYSNSSDTNLYPNALLADSGNLPSVAASLQQGNVSQLLIGGALYWVCLNSSSAATVMRAVAISSLCTILGANIGALPTTLNVAISVTSTFGTPPATFPAGGAYVTNVIASVPMLLARIS